ncbi:MAG: hypothetical protein AAF206_00785, partial [Bacteroidota bacterium]
MEQPKRHKRWILIGSITVLIFLFGQFWVNLLVLPVIEGSIREIVAAKSDGLYKVHHLDTGWDLGLRRFRLENVRIGPDSTTIQEFERVNGYLPRRVEIIVPEINLDLMDMRSLLVDRDLHLKTLRLRGPKIEWSSQTGNRSSAKGKAPESLYPYISGFLRSVEIEEIDIQEGSFLLNNEQSSTNSSFVAHDLDLNIRDFRIDSTSRQEVQRFFDAGEINLSVGLDQYAFILPDSSYIIKAQQLGLSAKNKTVFAEGLHIQPNYRRFQDLQDKGIPLANLFEVQIPRLEVEGIQVQEYFQTNELSLDAIRLIDPLILQLGAVGELSANTQQSLDPVQIHAAMRKFANEIHLGRIRIQNGHVQRLNRLGDTLRSLNLQGLDIELDQVDLDSSMLEADRRLLFSQNIDLSLDRYKVALSKGNYGLSGRDVLLSTRKESIRLGRFQLSPSPRKIRSARQDGLDVIELSFPQLQIDSLGFEKAWHDRVLDIGSVKLSAPDIQLTNFPRIQRAKVDSLAQANLYDLVSGFLDSLTVRKLAIGEGTFQIMAGPNARQEVLSASDLQISMRNFQLDPSAKTDTDNPFYAEDIDVSANVNNYTLTLPDSSYAITIGGLGISTADSVIFADSIRLKPLAATLRIPEDRNHQIARVLIPRLRLTGFDVEEAYFRRTLDVDSVQIQK